MKNAKQFWRTLLFFLLLAALCGSFAFPIVKVPARAAPYRQVVTDLVISEFRFRGSGGADDEFIEIFNPTALQVNLNGWKVNGSNNNGSTGTRHTFITDILLQPGQHVLLANIANVDEVTADFTYGNGYTPDGGVALVRPDNSIADAVGLSNGSAYKEGTVLSGFTSDVDQSYERKLGGATSCQDNNNNSSDFQLINPSNPQNLSNSPTPCLAVKNVTSSVSNRTYTTGNIIDITITFSNIIDVTGGPTLLLETGEIDRPAGYISGSGSDTLVFRYTVMSGDTSGDLDYVSNNSLVLNGGSITGAIGDAVLTLPNPGFPGSLGSNKEIVIENGVNPSLISFKRQNPNSTLTNTDSLTFRVTFSESVNNVGTDDFVVTGTTGTPSVTRINGSIYDVIVSGGDLANLNGSVGLNLSATQNITDASLNPLPTTEPPTDEIYTVENILPTVIINQAAGQLDPANAVPINFTVVFSEPIDVSTFTVSDITQSTLSGSAAFITWSITDSGDHTNFILSAISVAQNGNLTPSIAADRVRDLAGNNNIASTSTDNTVNFTDNVRPTVTVNQDSTQVDPASAFPIKFAVVFSEPINVSLFTSSDITQTGTATGITWTIIDSGDHKNFTLSATGLTGSGTLTLVPSIAANRVTDMVGNSNLASTSSDNTVTYSPAPPAGFHSVIINEIAWSGTKASEDDEWIELYNTTNNPIDLTGWVLKSDDNTPTISLTGYTIPGKSYLLLARKTGVFKDVTPNLVYGDSGTTHTLVNGGEVLRLKNASGTDIDVANSYSGYGFTKWVAGSASPNYASMERASFAINTPAEWFTFAGTPVAHDRSNNLVYGTPGKPNWAISVTATPSPARTSTPRPTPTRTLTPPPPPQLVAINEFVPRPGRDWNLDGVVNVEDEYVELLNHGVVDVNLSGYSLDDEVNIGSAPYRLPAVVIRPGERIVFYGSETGLLLSDGGDGVRLLKPNGQLMDAYNYLIVGYPDQSYCRLPDDGGADDWNKNCFPTPGLKNSLSGSVSRPSTGPVTELFCPIADTLPSAFALAECDPFGHEIWRAAFWDRLGWYDEKYLPETNGKWPVFAD